MPLLRICLLLSSAVLPLRSALAAGPPESLPFVIFETNDAPGRLDAHRLSDCLRLTLQEMNLDDRELPRIAVYHVSPKAGHYLGVDTNSNWRSNGGGTFRYEMWIVGEPSDYLFSYMIENILQRLFTVQVDDAARARIVRHVEGRLNATVDAHSFR